MKKILVTAVLLLTAFALVSCAAGPNDMSGVAADGEALAGFWQGVWHGFISFFTFIISLFNDNVNVYEVHNNGGWYNFGFIFGIMMFYGGGGSSSRRRRR
ncbi:MAG TPA: hypothetical protein VJ965_07715 [Anaerolineales bacterium]|nr:hypothetical protein [Anaerolineales bacterium]